MRHGGAAALRCDDLKRQILVHGTPPFRDLPEILNDNDGQYQQLEQDWAWAGRVGGEMVDQVLGRSLAGACPGIRVSAYRERGSQAFVLRHFEVPLGRRGIDNTD